MVADCFRLARGMATMCVHAAQLGFGVIQARARMAGISIVSRGGSAFRYRWRDEHRAARMLSTRQMVRARYRVAALRTSPPHSTRTDSTTLWCLLSRPAQASGGRFTMDRAGGATRSKRAARRCGDGWRAPSYTRCAFTTLFLVVVSISTRCRRRRAAGCAISSNFEWSVCGFARGGRDGRRLDPYERRKLRKWVCAACRDPAAAWSAVPREIA